MKTINKSNQHTWFNSDLNRTVIWICPSLRFIPSHRRRSSAHEIIHRPNRFPVFSGVYLPPFNKCPWLTQNEPFTVDRHSIMRCPAWHIHDRSIGTTISSMDRSSLTYTCNAVVCQNPESPTLLCLLSVNVTWPHFALRNPSVYLNIRCHAEANPGVHTGGSDGDPTVKQTG